MTDLTDLVYPERVKKYVQRGDNAECKGNYEAASKAYLKARNRAIGGHDCDVLDRLSRRAEGISIALERAQEKNAS